MPRSLFPAAVVLGLLHFALPPFAPRAHANLFAFRTAQGVCSAFLEHVTALGSPSSRSDLAGQLAYPTRLLERRRIARACRTRVPGSAETVRDLRNIQACRRNFVWIDEVGDVTPGALLESEDAVARLDRLAERARRFGPSPFLLAHGLNGSAKVVEFLESLARDPRSANRTDVFPAAEIRRVIENSAPTTVVLAGFGATIAEGEPEVDVLALFYHPDGTTATSRAMIVMVPREVPTTTRP